MEVSDARIDAFFGNKELATIFKGLCKFQSGLEDEVGIKDLGQILGVHCGESTMRWYVIRDSKDSFRLKTKAGAEVPFKAGHLKEYRNLLLDNVLDVSSLSEQSVPSKKPRTSKSNNQPSPSEPPKLSYIYEFDVVKIREILGLSREDFASILNVTPAMLERWETHKRAPASKDKQLMLLLLINQAVNPDLDIFCKIENNLR